ncbi:MAG TPA: amidase, partial [Bryobacteraceae bacterium]|nr:amidase [Bryobacteraceae bacterium]
LGVSLDHIGPLARTVADTAVSFEAMVEGDQRLRPAPASCQSIRIGLPENFYFDHIASEVRDAVRKAARAAEQFGAPLIPVKVPDIDALNDVGRVILLAEASAMYQPYFSRREDFGSDVLALLDQGRLVPAVDYVNAQRVRKVLVAEFSRLFTEIDVLLTPATPTTAPRIGQKQVELDGEMMDTRLATTRLVRGINVLGFPALSMPCGNSAEGLPIGLQLIGRPFEERSLLALGEVLDRR